MKDKNELKYSGLSNEEIIKSRELHGLNILEEQKKENIIIKILSIFKEPMFLLLLIAASVYFLVGEYADGLLMLVFVIGISLIEFLQETKTERALEELNKLSALNVKVIRYNIKQIISSDELVVGDIVILEEGDTIPADGKVLYSQSLGINESMLTGETETIYKTKKEDLKNHFKENICYSGTIVTNGMGIIEIINVGKSTELGKIGLSLNSIEKNKTPLEIQVNKIIFICTIISLTVFILTIIINFINYNDFSLSKRIVESIIAGITIAMATIPEEIPVVLTVFLAMGAGTLTKEKALTKSLKKVETLGAINVLCTDKTGTLTENKMVVKDIYSCNETFDETAYLSCQKVAYDPVDVAIKKYFQDKIKQTKLKIIKEYPFTSKNKMMGILWSNKTLYIKGAYESIIKLCNMNEKDLTTLEEKIKEYSQKGYKVIVAAKTIIKGEAPEHLNNLTFEFEGIIFLQDPPRKGVKKSIEMCNKAGIRVLMITGDNGDTARSIARELNIQNYEEVLTGVELENMSDEELFEKVKTVNIYARVYPEHKFRIVEALQKNGKIVGMTGDGVNDATALKKADIGIAMGERGTNVAKESADLILLDDNFNTIVKAIKNGRGIYDNIKKAISYILVIHMPIALLALFIPIFKLPILLLPVHIVLLELLIDPTSTILFQRIKPSNETMEKPPRNPEEKIINIKTFIKCMIQGTFIFIVTFLNYFYLINNNMNLNKARTITYSLLVLSIILTSFQLKGNKSTIYTLFSDLKDKTTILVNGFILAFLCALIYVPFFENIANTSSIGIIDWIYVILLSIIAVVPFDILKIKKRY